MGKHGIQGSSGSFVLVVVEGVSDMGFVEGLCKHLELDCDVKIMRGNRHEKAVRIIEATKSVRQFEKIVVLKDEHRLKKGILEEFRRVLEGRGARVIIVKKSIESWILALHGYIGAESIDDPVKELEHVIGRELLKASEKYRSIAEEILQDPQALERGVKISKSFKEFIEVLTN